jgi:tetratricopeptide (TPR) repeat protein
MYYDPYNRLHHRIIWPSYYYPVCYPFGPYASFGYVWPYYHRKYVFTSLGGWWPYDYDYMRYYWYGYHPYLWYGYYPIAREVDVGGNDYYTYNYYYGNDGGYTGYNSDTPMDPVTQARLRAQLEQQRAAPPAPQTLADTRFDEGVKSFEAGEYAAAALKFGEAMRLSPQDVILPFAYTQALFADGRYDKAADMLREALKNVTPEKEGVFFPRGLYANDDALFAQVEKLVDKVDSTENDADLQLLLGYQLLGVGETGYAREQLEQASQAPKDAVAAGILLNVVEKMEKEAGPAATKAGSGTIKMPASKTDKSTVAPTLPAESTPLVPAETAPAIPPEEKPDLQKKEPSNAGKESTGPVDESTVGPTQGMEQPAENNDNGGGAGAVQEGNPGAAAEKAGFLGSTATASVLPGWSGLMGRHAPNCKVDIAIFASILSLALAGVWIEWRLPGRQSV